VSAANRTVWLAAGAFVVAVVALVVAVSGAGGTGSTRKTTEPATAAPYPSPPTAPATGPIVAGGGSASPSPGGTDSAAEVTCPAATVTVSDASSLASALANARPGDSIRLADGTYSGRFTASVPGTAAQPIYLCGGVGAVIDGGGIKGGYAFHLDGASYWRLVGFTVRDGQKGVMADDVQHAVIQGLTVEQIGDEGIHLRDFSSDNVVQDNTVHTTGLRRDKFGEGVYIGSAKSNWCSITNCMPDKSNRNVVRGNNISATTAESVDIKEGTTDGVVTGNTFDGSALSGGNNDSWVDVKGNDWLISDNTGSHSLNDGFQTHEVVNGWGKDNTFQGNTAHVDGPGYGFHLTPVNGNKVTCDNKVSGASQGLANVACTP
jgi:hypothetical protein